MARRDGYALLVDTPNNDPDDVPLAKPIGYRTARTIEQRVERLERFLRWMTVVAFFMTGATLVLCYVVAIHVIPRLYR